MRRVKEIVGLAATALVLTVATGAPPNSLSGNWELDLLNSDFGTQQKPNFAVVRTITQNGAEIEVSDKITHPPVVEDVSRALPGSIPVPVSQPQKVEIETFKMFTDGRHSTVTSTRASFSVFASWQTSTLVVSMNGSHPGQFTQRETWKVSNNGKTLEIKQTIKSENYSNTVTYIFKRI